ncbi:MAG: hypothetical protein R3346_03570 [Candidatus Spechtbacterales bacterium]|nr:hypothetical protein [Candidatus Spechtbacterales bacterium]
MFTLAASMVGLVLLAGLIIKFTLDYNNSVMEITWSEFLIGACVTLFLIAPVTTWVGFSVAKSNALSFNEYWNGFELSTDWERTTCTRDGPCRREYDCDPYIHVHTSTDSEGNVTTSNHTHYHSCPYTTEEWTFTIDTTLGEYVPGNHWLPTNPDSHRWRASKPVPAGIPSGIPELWAEANQRVEIGEPGPVTRRMPYDNYILASDKSILKEFSSKINEYIEEGLLPDVAHNVHTSYYADKVSFVGVSPDNEEEWQTSLMYLNAALGTTLQGDLHLVVVRDAKINGEPDDYIRALKAYWSNPEVFGDDAISKNSIIVAVGTEDGKTVSWARATTGMPIGNEHMALAVKNQLPGTPLTPEDVIGNVDSEFYTETNDDGTSEIDARGVIHGEGELERILWGMDNPDTRFKRVSMSGTDEDDVGGGFLYLDAEIQPSTGQRILILVIGFILSMSAWIFGAVSGTRYRRNRGVSY